MQFIKEWNNNTVLREQVKELETQVSELTKITKLLGSAMLEVVGYVDNIKKMSHPTTNDDATK